MGAQPSLHQPTMEEMKPAVSQEDGCLPIFRSRSLTDTGQDAPEVSVPKGGQSSDSFALLMLFCNASPQRPAMETRSLPPPPRMGQALHCQQEWSGRMRTYLSEVGKHVWASLTHFSEQDNRGVENTCPEREREAWSPQQSPREASHPPRGHGPWPGPLCAQPRPQGPLHEFVLSAQRTNARPRPGKHFYALIIAAE